MGADVAFCPPPGGYIVDLDHPKTYADVATYWVVAVGNFLALMFMAQRLYTKTALLKEFRLEDVFLVFAWITSVGTQAVLVYMFAIGILGLSHLGLGNRLVAASLALKLTDTNPLGVQMTLVIPVIYTPCAGLAKLSLLLYYRRLSLNAWFRRFVILTMLVVAGYTLGKIFALIFGCNPIAMSWDNTIRGGTCIDRDALYFVTGILNIATNGIMLALPIPAVLSIARPNRQMIGLLLMFVIGGATVAASVMRFLVLLPALEDSDETWAMACPSMWLCVEANLLIICASLPTLRRFLHYAAPRLIGDDGFNDYDYNDDDRQRLTPSPRPGDSGRHHHYRWYNRFSDRFREYPMRSLRDVDLRPDAIQTVETRAGTNSRCSRMWDARPNKSDGDSEKAIFQTRTMTITYQNRDGSMSGDQGRE
ncbi:hypothetical protein PG996_004778 [Apiospora saccharicola]|uniref:Rhodopsin domain-containing protein n=1 Tax=Apiospora saccharicola TaxID=335842 RepID=A0ABR1W572_9PEZI